MKDSFYIDPFFASKVTRPFFIEKAKLHLSWACSLYYELQRSISMRSPLYLARKKLRIDVFFPAGFIDQQVMRLGLCTPQPVHPDGRNRRELYWLQNLLVSGGTFYNLELERLGFFKPPAPGTTGPWPTVWAKSPPYPLTPELKDAITHFEEKYWGQPVEMLAPIQNAINHYLSNLDTERELKEARRKLEELRNRVFADLSHPAQPLHRTGSAEKEAFDKELYLINNLIRFLKTVQEEESELKPPVKADGPQNN